MTESQWRSVRRHAGKFWIRLVATIVYFSAIYPTPVVQAAPSAEKAARVSECAVEQTQRIAFRLENPPAGAGPVGLRVSLYDAKNNWLADEILYGEGFSADAPIPVIAGLLDPNRVVSAKCSITGYATSADMLNFIDDVTLGRGQKACPDHGGLIVDGGPDVTISGIVYGNRWVYAEFQVYINHFLLNQETDLNGDVLQVRLDRAAMQKIVVSGRDPQYVGVLLLMFPTAFTK
jgi:hypothetical protein